MTCKIGVGDYVTSLVNENEWRHAVSQRKKSKAGPKPGTILRVVDTDEQNGNVNLLFVEFPKACLFVECFKKILPGGLDAWLDEVNMNPVKTKELHDATIA